MRERNTKTVDPPLGKCPACDATIPAANLVVAYEAAGDWPRMLAECPTCDEPVTPV
ncbi:DUF7837 family putative zinc-binding protein [Haloarcula salina]|uniref:DUF7837 domain-containing protein n=1 Tax=Haloarcula salina TaxID=1429914 RepID=A0AA41G2L6_9EURY|nr:hypothetical protein [Haloarcula salina]MBV0902268.1 hypothetical protein [Haloarcula salina]